MTGLAVATTSQLAAEAAAEVADAGGNAVDCAVAAALLTTNTEPGVCAIAGSCFVTIWPPSGDPVTIDGNVAVPGRGVEGFAGSFETVHMEYGGGVETGIGVASVAVPGSIAAFDHAIRKYGKSDWKQILQPSIRAARNGFPLSAACHHYLQFSGTPVFGRSRDGFNALHDQRNKLRPAGSTIIVPHLADSLETIANDGARTLYDGALAQRIAEHVQANGGLLTVEDLKSYQAIERPALLANLGDWRVASNPAPAVGGAILAAMLLGFADKGFTAWDAAAVRHLIDVQHAALNFRTDILDLSEDVSGDIERLLCDAASSKLIDRYASASTVHTSAVDGDGLACAVTASSGYGSGEMPEGTGLWLNNCMGELELNRKGLDAGPVGSRLPSNMAPTIARKSGTVLAVGSPGADRITTALQQFLINMIQMGMSLEQAIDYPRLHLDVHGPRPILAVEPGLTLPALDIETKSFPNKGMYFGGVGAAMFDSVGGFEVAADPRREGGTFLGG